MVKDTRSIIFDVSYDVPLKVLFTMDFKIPTPKPQIS